jgi:hypothetical protein
MEMSFKAVIIKSDVPRVRIFAREEFLRLCGGWRWLDPHLRYMKFQWYKFEESKDS